MIGNLRRQIKVMQAKIKLYKEFNLFATKYVDVLESLIEGVELEASSKPFQKRRTFSLHVRDLINSIKPLILM